jgi:hypothetical protein
VFYFPGHSIRDSDIAQEESPIGININWYSLDPGEMWIYEPSAYVCIIKVESASSLVAAILLQL